MTLADLRALDIPALWAGWTREQQDAIGAAAVAQQFAQLVAEDSGDDTTRDDRHAAILMASDAYDGIADVTEQAFPHIQWWDE